jgi:hypothetical protein
VYTVTCPRCLAEQFHPLGAFLRYARCHRCGGEFDTSRLPSTGTPFEDGESIFLPLPNPQIRVSSVLLIAGLTALVAIGMMLVARG